MGENDEKNTEINGCIMEQEWWCIEKLSAEEQERLEAEAIEKIKNWIDKA